MYLSTSSLQVPARRANDTPCSCTRHCYDKVPADQRKRLFDGFWSVSRFDVQNAYLCECVKIMEIGRRYTSRRSESHRSYTRVYYVNNGSISVKVCKVAFLRMHGVSSGRLSRALKAQKDAAGSPHTDQRGRHEPVNKIKEEDIDIVRAHICSFPHYRSHYSRADNPHKQFLSLSLSLQLMYKLYKQKCAESNMWVVSEWVYRREFNENFNLSFGTQVPTHSM